MISFARGNLAILRSRYYAVDADRAMAENAPTEDMEDTSIGDPVETRPVWEQNVQDIELPSSVSNRNHSRLDGLQRNVDN